MPREIDLLVAPSELLERCHVVAHGAVGRCHHGRRPRHDVIAGQQDLRLLVGECHVVCGMAGRCDRLEGEAAPAHHRAIGERDVRPECLIAAGVEPLGLADMERPRRPVRTLGIDRGTGRRLDARRRRGVVAMGVGDEDVGHGLAAHRIEDRCNVPLVVRTRIDHRDLAVPDDVRHRPLERERPRVVGDEPPQAGHDFLDLAGREVEAFVERDVVGHGQFPRAGRGVLPARPALQPSHTSFGRTIQAHPIVRTTLHEGTDIDGGANQAFAVTA